MGSTLDFPRPRYLNTSILKAKLLRLSISADSHQNGVDLDLVQFVFGFELYLI
jgi:hypothetical protein